MSRQVYQYCPMCAKPLQAAMLGEVQRQVCGGEDCGFVQWGNPVPVVAALVEYEDRILLARNVAWPEHIFALITGFLEAGESPEDGMKRELKEETDLDCISHSLIGVYPFPQKNEVVICYHAVAQGTIRLSEELADYRLIEPHKLRPWPMGTGLAMADWLRSKNLPVQWLELK